MQMIQEKVNEYKYILYKNPADVDTYLKLAEIYFDNGN